jgi:hypothetical protein
MPTLPQPDYVALAHQLGLVNATYPALEMFDHLGIGRSLGWQLVADGKLHAIRLTGKKTVTTSVSAAKFLRERQQQPPPQRARGRRKAVAS